MKISFSLLSLGVAVCATAAPVQFSGNGHYYDVTLSALSYDAAKTAALGQSFMGSTGHLAQWEDSGELDFIASAYYPLLSGNQSLWLGGESNGRSDPFRYSTGGLADTSRFTIDYFEGDTRSGLGLFNLNAGAPYFGDYIANNAGGYMVGYVTEFQPVPEPATCAALGFGALGLLRRRRKA